MGIAGRRTRALTAACAALTITCVVAACGGDDGGGGAATGTTQGAAATGADREIKVGAALIGPRNDKSFDQAAYEGIRDIQAKFPNFKLTSALENRVDDQQRVDAIETLAPVNDLVVSVSSSFGPVLDVEAPKFPNAYFLNIAGYTKTFQKNVTGFANDWGAMLYVAGVVAANLTKTKTVGFVGGAEIPPTIQGLAGFKAGVRSVDPKLRILENIVGDFNDVAKAKNGTAAMIADGADVIFPFINGGLPGVYAAGRESGKNPGLFSQVIPDCGAYPNMVGTDFVDNQSIVKRLLTDYIEGRLKPGAFFLALQEPDLQTLQLCPKYESNAKIAKVREDTIAAINDGKVKLPAAAVNPRPDYPYREGFDGPLQNAGAGQ
jgi:basic membrane protein A